MIPTVVVVAALAMNPHKIAFEALLQHYAELTSQVETLEVVYTHSRTGAAFGDVEELTNRLLFRQRPNGTCVARMDVCHDGQTVRTYFLIGKDLYSADATLRTVTRFPLGETTTKDFLRSYWHPLIALLDPPVARQTLRFRVRKSSDWYTYHDVLPRLYGSRHDRAKISLEMPSRMELVTLNVSTDAVPSAVPYRIWTRLPNGDEELLTVKSWKTNGDQFPDQLLRLPNKTEGWTMVPAPDFLTIPSREPLSLSDLAEALRRVRDPLDVHDESRR